MTPAMKRIDQFVILFGHSVFKGGDPRDENSWFLTATQLETGVVPLIMEQIAWAILYLVAHPHALLIFSGGYTRGTFQDPIFRSEADSYLEAALKANLIPDPALLSRIAIEPCARNSLENFIFGLACGYEITGRRPRRIVCAGLEHKRQRILTHAKIAGFQLESECAYSKSPVVAYQGVNDFAEPHLAKFKAGEGRFLAMLQDEPHGMGGLAAVRYQQRNPYLRQPKYLASSASWPQLHAQLAIAYEPDGVII